MFCGTVSSMTRCNFLPSSLKINFVEGVESHLKFSNIWNGSETPSAKLNNMITRIEVTRLVFTFEAYRPFAEMAPKFE